MPTQRFLKFVPVQYLLLMFLLGLVSCASPKSAKQHDSQSESLQTFQGVASWYGRPFHGRRMANGQRFDMNRYTAAHRTLPFGTRVEVTNLQNNQSVILTITDRGPFIRNRIIDVSRKAAQDLGFIGAGTATVEIKVLPLETEKN